MSEDRKSLSPEPGLSVSVKFAVAVGVALIALSSMVGITLSQRARGYLIESRMYGATMVVELLTTTLEPVLDFGDQNDIAAELSRLQASADISYVGVWPQGAEKPVELHPDAITVSDRTRPSVSARPITEQPDRLVAIRQLESPTGGALGALVVHFSLEQANAQFHTVQRQIFMLSAAMAVLVAAVVYWIARSQIIFPLDKLLGATRTLESGEVTTVEITSSDEIGRLGRAFNRMGAAIEDRENRLAEARARLQELLDHMRQGIIVVDPDGTIESVQSRQAEVIFSGHAKVKLPVGELLYPDETEGVEAEALKEWLDVVFEIGATDWAAVDELAPKEVVLGRGTEDERILDLEFQPIIESGDVARVMLLVSDETERHQLQRTVKEKDEEHTRQMAAMRRLVVGGGQLVVGVLNRARTRLSRCNVLLPENLTTLQLVELEELFQHVHTIKGEAQVFDLDPVVAASASLEDDLGILRTPIRAGNTDIPLEVSERLVRECQQIRLALDNAETMLIEASPVGAAVLQQITVGRDDISRLAEIASGRKDEIGELANRLASRPFGECALSLLDAVPRWASTQRKRAHLDISGRDVMVPPDLAAELSGVLTQIVRNSVIHGIETTDERTDLGKDPLGTIQVSCEVVPGRGLKIVTSDDGRGLNISLVKEAAMAAGAGDLEATEAVFAPGVSTEAAGDLAGRGAGMGAVRETLKPLGYVVSVDNRPGQGLTITISPKMGDGNSRPPRLGV